MDKEFEKFWREYLKANLACINYKSCMKEVWLAAWRKSLESQTTNQTP